jgi:hypothetical protein
MWMSPPLRHPCRKPTAIASGDRGRDPGKPEMIVAARE